jgi:hypothetical protein
MLKRMLLLPVLFTGATNALAQAGQEENSWDLVALSLAIVILLALLIAVFSGLLILLRAAAPKFTAKCAKSITGKTLRNFLVGLGILLVWLVIAHMYEGNEKALGILVMILGVFWCVKMFGGAAMCELVGTKVLALRAGKKQTDGMKTIVTGLSVIMLATATIIPGLLVLLVLSCIELGAVVCVSLKVK